MIFFQNQFKLHLERITVSNKQYIKGMRSHVRSLHGPDDVTMLSTLSTSIGRLSLRMKVPLAMLLTAAGPVALHTLSWPQHML